MQFLSTRKRSIYDLRPARLLKPQKIGYLKSFCRNGSIFIITLSNGAIQYINIENAWIFSANLLYLCVAIRSVCIFTDAPIYNERKGFFNV